MKLNAALMALFLLAPTQTFSWEWPMSLLTSPIGSWFMDKDQKYFYNLVLKTKNEINAKHSKKEDQEISLILKNSYVENLKRLTTYISSDNKDLKKEKLIIQRNLFIHGVLSNLAENNKKPEEIDALAASPQKNTHIFRLMNPKETDRIKPSSGGTWILPSLEGDVNTYKELCPASTFNSEINEIKERYSNKKFFFKDDSQSLKDSLRADALLYIERRNELDDKIKTHNNAVNKNLKLYQLLLNKHGIKLA